MSIIFVLIPLAIIIVSIAIGVFFWAVKSNQFDDLERQGYSILFDDDIKPPQTTDNTNMLNDTEGSNYTSVNSSDKASSLDSAVHDNETKTITPTRSSRTEKPDTNKNK